MSPATFDAFVCYDEIWPYNRALGSEILVQDVSVCNLNYMRADHLFTLLEWCMYTMMDEKTSHCVRGMMRGTYMLK